MSSKYKDTFTYHVLDRPLVLDGKRVESTGEVTLRVIKCGFFCPPNAYWPVTNPYCPVNIVEIEPSPPYRQEDYGGWFWHVEDFRETADALREFARGERHDVPAHRCSVLPELCPEDADRLADLIEWAGFCER